MSNGISVPFIVPIDIRCSKPGCSCIRSVPGNGDGNNWYRPAPKAGTICSDCSHPIEEHNVVGPSKKRKREKPRVEPVGRVWYKSTGGAVDEFRTGAASATS